MEQLCKGSKNLVNARGQVVLLR